MASAFFWTSYLFVTGPLSKRLIPSMYPSFNQARLLWLVLPSCRTDADIVQHCLRLPQFNERCWRQNLLSGIHTTVSVSLLTAGNDAHLHAPSAVPFKHRCSRIASATCLPQHLWQSPPHSQRGSCHVPTCFSMRTSP